jgi:hypothetical protein
MTKTIKRNEDKDSHKDNKQSDVTQKVKSKKQYNQATHFYFCLKKTPQLNITQLDPTRRHNSMQQLDATMAERPLVPLGFLRRRPR